MGIQIVLHKMNGIGVGVGIDHLLDESRIVRLLPAFRHLRLPSAAFWFYRHEDIARTVANVLIIPDAGLARLGCFRCPAVFEQLLALLIEAHHRFLRIVWLGIDLQNVFHALFELRRESRNAPHFFPATASGHVLSRSARSFVY